MRRRALALCVPMRVFLPFLAFEQLHFGKNWEGAVVLHLHLSDRRLSPLRLPKYSSRQ
jgi:hypothetical protein